MKKSFLLVITILLVNFVFTQTSELSSNGYYVSIDDAKTVGVNFHANQAKKLNPVKYGNVDYSVKEQRTLKTADGLECMHLFNFNDGGFVLVSADIRTVPILAYSNEGKFDYDNMAPATKSWIEENYMPQYEIINELNLEPNQEITKLWNDISKNNFSFDKSSKGVDILLSTRWNQDYPYNMYCPPHPEGPHGRVYAGCVATAMSQVMKYWDYPEIGRDSVEYYWGDYITVNFSDTEYRWDEMAEVATSINRESIAELMYHCGVSVDMGWGYDGSGTQTYLSTYALQHYFRYRPGITYVLRDYLDDDDWKFTIKEDLDKGHPVIYDGNPNDGSAGHAFVCDGYQDTSYFHFNWGWGGSNDGFYFIDNLNPNPYDFNYGQGAVTNITPNYADYCSGSTYYTQPEWSFGDGSGDNYYFNDTYCDWTINPDVEDFYLLRLTFTKFDLAENDVLKVYKGHPSNSALTLVGEYTAGNRPYTIDNWGGDKFYLVFETNGEGQADGWEAYYTTYATGVEVNSLTDVNIYPNPANEMINITGIYDANIAIYDIYGKLIMEINNTDSTGIDISDFSAGVYFINISNNDDIKTMKFIKN